MAWRPTPRSQTMRQRRRMRADGSRRSRIFGLFRSRSKGRRDPCPYALSLLHVFNFGQHADELTENHGRRAPHLVTEKIEVGVLDRNALANSRALTDPRCITHMGERYLEDLLDFSWRRRKVRPPIR